MSCGYWLRVNGHWLPLEDVQSGVDYGFERARDGFSSVGGVAHSQEALRATRTWRVSLGELVGPESVAALMMAAQQDAGDVMLWDESAARANLLDPVLVRGRDDCPVMVCDGVPLRAVTGGGTTTVDVPLLANVTVEEYPTMIARIAIDTVPGVAEALVKVAVPATPSGYALTDAALVLHRSASSSGTVTAYTASSGWVEPTSSPTPATYWDTVPAGPSRGSATVADTTAIPISGVTEYVGGVMSLRLVKTSGALGAYFYPRTHATKAPMLRLTYTRIPQDITVTQHLRAGSYWLTYWTDAAAGTQVGTLEAQGATLPIITGSGSGLRRISVDLSAFTTADRDWTLTLDDSPDYLLGGLMLTTIPATHYLPGHKTPVRVTVDDPSLNLGMLLPGQQGVGQRSVTIREVG